MSITVMSLVWPAALPPVEKLTLLRLADFADDEGGHVFPSLARLAHETGCNERSVRRALRWLEGVNDNEPAKTTRAPKPTVAGVLKRPKKPRPAALKLLTLVAEADPGRKRPREYRIEVDRLRGLGKSWSGVSRSMRPATERGDTMSPVAGGTPCPPSTAGGGTQCQKRGDTVSPRYIKKEPSRENTHPRLRSARSLASVKEGETAETSFAAFWKLYPRKVAKRMAEKAYRSAVKRATAATILAGARRYAEHVAEKVARDSSAAQFVAHAATWLNGDRWADLEGVATATPSTPDPVREAAATRFNQAMDAWVAGGRAGPMPTLGNYLPANSDDRAANDDGTAAS